MPSGRAAAAAAVTAEDETATGVKGASTSNGVEQKWKKNYVPFKETDGNNDKEKE